MVVPASLATAAVSYALIERPFLRMRRRWSDGEPVVSQPRVANVVGPTVARGS